MSDDRRPRRRARRSNSDAPRTGDAAALTPATSEEPESTPLVRVRRVDRAERAKRARRGGEASATAGPSKMRYVLLFFAGIFVGRVAEVNFGPDALSILSLVTYGAIALGIAWMWRNWARRAVEQRQMQTQRRQRAPRDAEQDAANDE